MYVYKMNASPKLWFFWTVCKTIVLTGTLKLPQNLQTWKVLTQILHLVIYPIHYTCTCRGNVIHVRTNFKPNCSKIFRCACTKTSDTYIVYILFLIQLYKYILEKYVTLDLSKPFRSKSTVFRCGVLPQLAEGLKQVATEEKRSRTEYVTYVNLDLMKLKLRSNFCHIVYSLISSDVT